MKRWKRMIVTGALTGGLLLQPVAPYPVVLCPVELAAVCLVLESVLAIQKLEIPQLQRHGSLW